MWVKAVTNNTGVRLFVQLIEIKKWLSKLLLSGLLKGSFIPPQDIRELRDLVRYKKKIVGQLASEKNRIIKILEDAKQCAE